MGTTFRRVPLEMTPERKPQNKTPVIRPISTQINPIHGWIQSISDSEASLTWRSIRSELKKTKLQLVPLRIDPLVNGAIH